MAKYIVEIERTEHYRQFLRVNAKSEQEARRKAEDYDSNDGLANDWEEQEPVVDTEYYATEEELSTLPEDLREHLEEIP